MAQEVGFKTSAGQRKRIKRGHQCVHILLSFEFARGHTMSRFMTLLSFYVTLLISSVSAAPPSSQVRLTSGIFTGLSVSNGTERWLGIPFAEPPLGPLRFKAPEALKQPSRNAKTAATFGDACPQAPSLGLGAPTSEDCLFLNVCLEYSRCLSIHGEILGLASFEYQKRCKTPCSCLVLCECCYILSMDINVIEPQLGRRLYGWVKALRLLAFEPLMLTSTLERRQIILLIQLVSIHTCIVRSSFNTSLTGIINRSVAIGKPIIFVSTYVLQFYILSVVKTFPQQLSCQHIRFCEYDSR